MSCDNAARQGIAGICAAHSAGPEVQARIEAVHDLPPTLRDDETVADLRREARIFKARLLKQGVELPDHLDLNSDTSRTLVRWGRANKALREAGIGVSIGPPSHHRHAEPPAVGDGLTAFTATLKPSIQRTILEEIAADLSNTPEGKIMAATYQELGFPLGGASGSLPNGTTFPVPVIGGKPGQTIGLDGRRPVVLSNGSMGTVVNVESQSQLFQRADGSRFRDWAARVGLAQGGIVTVPASAISALELPRTQFPQYCGNCGQAKEQTGHRCKPSDAMSFPQLQSNLALATHALMGKGDQEARRADLGAHIELDEPDLRVRARAVLDYLEESIGASPDDDEADPVIRNLDPSTARGVADQLAQSVYPMDGDLDRALRAWTRQPQVTPLSEGGPNDAELARLKEQAQAIRAMPQHLVPHKLSVAAAYLLSSDHPHSPQERGWRLAFELGDADATLSRLHNGRDFAIRRERRQEGPAS